MSTIRQTLPLGDADFSKLRHRESVYVDKTDLIYRLVTGNSDKIFFARPQHFGKTLLISTLASLFQYGLRDFDGLAIEKLWEERTYSVVRLDFSQICTCATHEKWSERFWAYIAVEFSPLSDRNLIGINSQATALNISNLLRDLPERSLVILIDDYAAPLTEGSHEACRFERIRKEMDFFFRMLKFRDRCVRLLFVTGVTQYRQVGLFDGFSNVKDCSMLPAYGTLFGFTDEELTTYFEPSLQLAAKAVRLSPGDLVDRLKRCCGGYRFDCLSSTEVFCPWSVLKFLDKSALGLRNDGSVAAGHPNGYAV